MDDYIQHIKRWMKTSPYLWFFSTSPVLQGGGLHDIITTHTISMTMIRASMFLLRNEMKDFV
jgi:hypothetical protein